MGTSSIPGFDPDHASTAQLIRCSTRHFADQDAIRDGDTTLTYLIGHPLVGMAAVIGAPDDRMGEVGAAFIVPCPDGTPDTGELIGWCREHMANYKVPRHVFIVDELPLTASNKVRKPDLRQLAANLLDE